MVSWLTVDWERGISRGGFRNGQLRRELLASAPRGLLHTSRDCAAAHVVREPLPPTNDTRPPGSRPYSQATESRIVQAKPKSSAWHKFFALRSLFSPIDITIDAVDHPTLCAMSLGKGIGSDPPTDQSSLARHTTPLEAGQAEAGPHAPLGNRTYTVSQPS